MGYKSRSGWSIPVCLRDCRNRDIDCEECFGFSKFVRNISDLEETQAQNGQKHGVDNPRKLDIENPVRLPKSGN
jgi:hypothetical protein